MEPFVLEIPLHRLTRSLPSDPAVRKAPEPSADLEAGSERSFLSLILGLYWDNGK